MTTEQIDDARGDLNALIREAHEATKDLKQASKNLDERITLAKQMVGDFEVTMERFEGKVKDVADLVIGDMVDDRMVPVIEAFLEVLTKQLQAVKDAVTESVKANTGHDMSWLELPDELFNSNFPRRDHEDSGDGES